MNPHQVSKGFGEKLLYEDLNFKLPAGGIVGIIGPNGAGKSTLFRMIVGDQKPDAGEIRLGDTVSLSYVDQGRTLDPNLSIHEAVSDGADIIKPWRQRGELSCLYCKV